ncbi:Asp-tRNA(Asn)/Glu-tRNA(Gln) amidotransferase subunit GatB [Spongiibacter sp. KMU-158]|uniref:Aspartyl/glutamyl-tRNA(Asn/Gln) amidotransferase subunit B n=1 Tax=Spongiibacter pelagi TaxID=2760804 RepID=A0A927C353_9GAMM|nr:Asp-tRNA(Asn)/Glu-tRNA(Gln) amidotransferase subunit GatB [Spongiibacter pelagi]MBD2858761.1 Asp-tRNA(Asn)/Glu-tRNA(Gln) amidotransferase subunit GatB [Spongiibacter pelagi]
MEWETVIGLEVHVQLNTQSKIFSGASTAFGSAPNTQACAVDLALPGTLPVLNEQALKDAILFGLAIDAEICQASVFERKNYFYPDLPKGYQTSQMDAPIVGAGVVEISLEDGSTRQIRVHHAHLEEDAGKSLHEANFEHHGQGQSGIDLNRAGTPLIEIVSEPDMRSAEEAVAYLRKLHSIITYLGISDGDMSQGSMRCDANVSVRFKGEEQYGTRAEIKNINSFRFVDRAIKVEAQRQIDVLEDGGKIVQETRLYDSDKNETRSMRSKEEANDYRYFPCPDLLPVKIESSLIEQLRTQLPELPDAKRQRFESEYGLSAYDAGLLTGERAIADYFEDVAKLSGDAKLAANWVNGELSAALNKEDMNIAASPVSAEQLGGLIQRIRDNTISGKIAKQVFEGLWNKEADSADAYIDAKGLKQVSDTGALEAMVDEVIANNPEQVEQYRAADDGKRKKLIGFFVGQIMKVSKGQANPGMVNKLLNEKLGG